MAKDTALTHTRVSSVSFILFILQAVEEVLTSGLLRRASRDGAASMSITEDGPKKRGSGR